jgi:hypothetical protein
MNGRYGGPWIILPVLLSVVFVALFLPATSQRHGLPASLGLSLLGVVVIWASYLIRAHIFSSWAEKPSKDPDRGGHR